jgi:crotonobetainyl-CoA:carnitine CoA-transferase CaiB-like acyl-CoA transferase
MLEGLKVIELASDRTAYTAKLLADFGADVIVIEPPGGSPTRLYGPFQGNKPDAEKSLWWWYYNTSKRSLVLDLASADGAKALAGLVSQADIVVEAESPGRLASLGLDPADVMAKRPELIWVSVTPFGTRCADLDVPMTDLTILAASGVIWNCGYDDHSIPPVRPGGGQAQHIAGLFGAMGALVAVLNRDETGAGQHVDVSMLAAANITTELGTTEWLVAKHIVQRQTGRHATTMRTAEVQVLASDGLYVTTGFPPHEAEDFRTVLDWLTELGLAEEFPETALLQLGIDTGGVDYRKLATDALVTEIYGAGRAAIVYIASHMAAYEFFIAAQERDLQCGIIYAPEDALNDIHYRERGFPVAVMHPELGQEFVYPGAPFRGHDGSWRISRRAPLLDEGGSDGFADLATAP